MSLSISSNNSKKKSIWKYNAEWHICNDRMFYFVSIFGREEHICIRSKWEFLESLTVNDACCSRFSSRKQTLRMMNHRKTIQHDFTQMWNLKSRSDRDWQQNISYYQLRGRHTEIGKGWSMSSVLQLGEVSVDTVATRLRLQRTEMYCTFQNS